MTKILLILLAATISIALKPVPKALGATLDPLQSSAALAEEEQYRIERDQIKAQDMQLKKEDAQILAEIELHKNLSRLGELNQDEERIRSALASYEGEKLEEFESDILKLRNWNVDNLLEIEQVLKKIRMLQKETDDNLSEAKVLLEKSKDSLREANEKRDVVHLLEEYRQQEEHYDSLPEKSNLSARDKLHEQSQCASKLESLATQIARLKASSSTTREEKNLEGSSEVWVNKASIHQKDLESLNTTIELHQASQRFLIEILWIAATILSGLTIYIKGSKFQVTDEKLKKVLKVWINWIAFHGLSEDMYHDLIENLKHQMNRDDFSRANGTFWLMYHLSDMLLASFLNKVDDLIDPSQMKGSGDNPRSQESHPEQNEDDTNLQTSWKSMTVISEAL
jgi:hypothetical protein